jgi:hypothetical protein
MFNNFFFGPPVPFMPVMPLMPATPVMPVLFSHGYGFDRYEPWSTYTPTTWDFGPCTGLGVRSGACQDGFAAGAPRLEQALETFASALSQLGAWVRAQHSTKGVDAIDVNEVPLPPILVKETPDMFRRSKAEPALSRPAEHEHAVEKAAELAYVAAGGVTASVMDTLTVPAYPVV